MKFSRYSFALGLVLDDHNLYAETFASFLERIGIFEQVHSFRDGQSLLNYISHLSIHPTIYLFSDFYLQNQTTSLPLINELKRIYSPLYIIMTSSVTNPITIQGILNSKIDGFLSKNSETTEILSCIRSIHNRTRYISPSINELIDGVTDIQNIPFSFREIEILHHFSNGLSVAETAKKMILSKHTIISHRRRMMAKAGSKSITELLNYCRKLGIL